MKSFYEKAIAFYIAHPTLVRAFGAMLAVIAIVSTPLINVILGFLIVGQIPGASRTVPYWLMMLGYVLVITAVLTYSIETLFQRKKTATAKKSPVRATRRRYSHS